VNDGRFAVHGLPMGSAQQQTTDDDEIAFRFGGVHCDVDESDGSFVVRANYRDMHPWNMARMSITRTGTIDNKGQYTFSAKSIWTKRNFDRAAHSNADIAYYDSAHYYVNDIELKLRQRKVYIRV
jgi:hypothetical protein